MRPLATVLLLAACASPPPPTADPPGEGDLVLLRPYRAAADPCRLAGESAATADYLDDAADLVACPVGMEDPGGFARSTGGREVGRVGDRILYSVPRR